ncbi:hypothetical protein F4781DRAFT_415008 [Annulohypoxylon bovei var. microspora]|nr:hypothetical protein F4781DRAFT_415008 [Annulohypoxylon bovei var. microspora]
MFFRNRKKNLPYPSDWVNSVLRHAYKDGHGVKQGLDELLGADKYTLKLRNGRWVIWAPRKLNDVRERINKYNGIERNVNCLKMDQSKIESIARVHYRP